MHAGDQKQISFGVLRSEPLDVGSEEILFEDLSGEEELPEEEEELPDAEQEPSLGTASEEDTTPFGSVVVTVLDEEIEISPIVKKTKEEKEPADRCQEHVAKVRSTSLSSAVFRNREVLKAKIRNSLPVLSYQEVRRHRIPYDDAKYLDLLEGGYASAANYFRQLVEHDAMWKEEARKKSKEEPMLKELPALMDELVDGLQNAEEGKQNDDALVESSEMLRLAQSFGRRATSSWGWITDQLYQTTIDVATSYRADGGRKEAVARYLYSLFLVNQRNEMEEAAVQLHTARELAQEKKWIASPELEGAFENLFRQICCLLYSALLRLSQRIRKTNPLRAVDYCAIAVKRAIEADKDEGIAATMMEQGLCRLSTGEWGEALNNFRETLKRSLAAENHLTACDAHRWIARALIKLKDYPRAERHLNMMLRLAETHHLASSRGQAHQSLGEFYLHGITYMSNAYEKSVAELEVAMKIFNELGMYQDLSMTRAMHAVAKGQQLMKRYLHCVCRAGVPELDPGGVELTRLIQWKVDRTPFWCEEESETNSSLDEEQSVEGDGEEESTEGSVELDVVLPKNDKTSSEPSVYSASDRTSTGTRER